MVAFAKEHVSLASNRILMILDSHYPPDIRVDKEINALIDAGFSVDLLCYRKQDQPIVEELRNGNFRILRTALVVNHFFLGLIDIANAVFFRNYFLQVELNKLQNPVNFVAVHAHDLPISNTAYRWAKKHGLPFLLDLHENYPEALGIWFSWRKNIFIKWKNAIFFNYSRWIKREREMVLAADYNIAVVDEMKDRLIKLHGVSNRKVLVVSNTEPKERNKSAPSTDRSTNRCKNIIYVGGIGPHRGLQTAISAMPEILRYNPSFKLIIVGPGNKDNLNYLKNLIRTLAVDQSVEFTGKVPLNDALAYMKNAFINIIPHLKNDHTDNTIPHKLFQIMDSDLPLMVSSCSPLKRIVESENCGVIFNAGDPADFAAKVIWADNNSEKLKDFALNGRRAVQEGKWNWERDSEVIINIYKKISGVNTNSQQSREARLQLTP